MAIKPWQRPAASTSLGNHEERVRDLERARPEKPRFAYIDAINLTVPPGTQHIDFPADRFFTNDVSLFDYGLDTLGSGVHCIRYLDGGLYRLWVTCQFSGAGAGNWVTLYHSPVLNPSQWLAGNPDLIIPAVGPSDADGQLGQTDFAEMQFGGEPGDGIVFPAAEPIFVVNRNLTDFHVFISAYIELIDADVTDMPR